MPEELPADLASSNSFDFLDHIVFGCLDLQEGCDYLAKLTGLTPTFGGVHEGRGTHNALLGLGDHTYLEIVAPDPEQAKNNTPLWMNITPEYNLKVIGWAAKSSDLAGTLQKAQSAGTDLGSVEAGSRKQSNGQILSWHLTLPSFGDGIGMIPFFVDWGDSVHPAPSLPQLGKVVDMRLSHPLPEKLSKHLGILDTPLSCELGPAGITLQVKLQSGQIVEL